MTDKEIIIDGVDVSKCRHFLKDTIGPDYNTDEYVKGCCEAKGCYIECEFIGYSICRGDKDCYYKQLSRKTAECDELKEKIRIKDDENSNLNKKYRQEQAEKFSYRKALEEIENFTKKHCDFYCEHNRILNIINKAKDINVPHKKDGE